MKKFIAAAAVAASVSLVPVAAHAAPVKKDAATPGCFSHREFLDMERGTQSQVEARNGVSGLGKITVWSAGGDHLVRAYPWCDHGPEDSIQISYDRNARGQLMANYATEWDMPGPVRQP